jgi:hypothetical protein
MPETITMNLRNLRHVWLAALAIIAVACGDDDGVIDPANRGPQAFIRFVHAVPDTGAVDFRFVDKLENLPLLLAVPFRGVSGAGYIAVDPGERPVRIFVNSLDPVEAVKRLVDTTITLTANSRYTLVYGGSARGNQDRLEVIEDEATIPSATTGILLRAMNAAKVLGTVSIAVAPAGTGAAGSPSTASFPGLAYPTKSAYAPLAARPTGAGNLYTFTVTPTTGSPFTVTPDEPGTPAPDEATFGPVPGMQIPGSVLTAVVVPGAVAGSDAVTTDPDTGAPTNLTPTVLILIDKQIVPTP